VGDCNAIRVDHLNFNGTEAQDINACMTDGNDSVWVTYSAFNASGGFNIRVFQRKYTPSTDNLTTAVQIDDNEAQGARYPKGVRLQTGRQIMAYRWRTGPTTGGINIKESTDDGLNWSAGTQVTAVAAQNHLLDPLCMIVNDATGDVRLFARYTAKPLGFNYSIVYWDRTAVGVWGPFQVAFSSTSFSQEQFFGSATLVKSAAEIGSIFDGARTCIIGDRTHLGNPGRVRALYTFPDALTWNESADIYTVENTFRYPKAAREYSNRLWTQWVDESPETAKLHLAYSNNAGANWTHIGTPTGTEVLAWDASFSHAIAIDSADLVFSSTVVSAGPHDFYIFKGGPDPNGWVKIDECDLLSPYNTATAVTNGVGDSLFVGTTHLHLGSYIDDDGPASANVLHLMFIKHPGIGANGTLCPTPPCPPPPPPPPPCPGPEPCTIYTPPVVPPPPLPLSGVYLPRGMIHVTRGRDGEDICAPMESWGSTREGGP
jgi:hypothetical protein